MDNENTAAVPEDFVPPKEMMIEASGKGADGLPKTRVGLFFQYVNMEGESVKDVRSVVMLDPILNIHKNLTRIYVDLQFSDASDVYLSMMNDILIEAFQADASIEDDSSRFPLVTLTMIPEKYNGRYYMQAYDPALWALTSPGPREKNTILRLIFDDNDFQFLFNPDETMAQIGMELKAEEEKEQKKADRIREKDERRRRGKHF